MEKVYPQPNGDASKVKVKVRVNLHGIFNVASAALVEKVEKETESPAEGNKAESELDMNGRIQRDYSILTFNCLLLRRNHPL